MSFFRREKLLESFVVGCQDIRDDQRQLSTTKRRRQMDQNINNVPAIEQVSINKIFGIPAGAQEILIAGRTAPAPYTPAIDPYYKFEMGHLRDVIAWLKVGMGEGLFLTGPTGAGKSSLVLQVAARLNLEVFNVTAHERLEFSDLVGQFVVKNGNMEYQYGPLALAMKRGGVFLLDEIDALPPGTNVGLNGAAEGRVLVIPENGGEVIKPHPEFRFAATGNTRGSGDDTGRYSGTIKQNLAFLDRFWCLEVGYLSKQKEEAILESVLPVPEMKGLIPKFLEVAEEVRRLFQSSDFTTQINTTISTRSLIRWVRLTHVFLSMAKRGCQPVYYALDRAILNKAAPEEKAAVKEIVQRIFGISEPEK